MNLRDVRKTPTWAWCICTVACALAGCGKSDVEDGQPLASTRDVIVTTFYPTTWMTQKIVGDAVPVECLVPDGDSASEWRPNDTAIQQLQSAKLVVLNGAGFEKWAITTTLPASRVVDTTVDLPGGFIQYADVITHQHGPVGDQSREGIDEHTWLDPIIAKHQATQIVAAAKRTWPQHAARFNENLQLVNAEFDKLADRLKAVAPKLTGVRLLCAEPAYNYVARQFDWKIENAGLAPSMTAEEILSRVKVDGSKSKPIVLWANMPSANLVDELMPAGVRSVPFSTGVAGPGSDDYMTLMNANVDALQKALGDSPE